MGIWTSTLTFYYRAYFGEFVLAPHTMMYRYSDRVKEETERLNQLELDDLEASCLCSSLLSLLPLLQKKVWDLLWVYIYLYYCLLQVDEDEKYNRKLESGLYTLQVSTFFLLLAILHSTGDFCSRLTLCIKMQLIAVILGHLWTSE